MAGDKPLIDLVAEELDRLRGEQSQIAKMLRTLAAEINNMRPYDHLFVANYDRHTQELSVTLAKTAKIAARVTARGEVYTVATSAGDVITMTGYENVRQSIGMGLARVLFEEENSPMVVAA